MAIQDDSAFDVLVLSVRRAALQWARVHSGQNVYLDARSARVARGSSVVEVARARYMAIQDDSAFDALDGSVRNKALQWTRTHSGQNVYLDARAARGSSVVEVARARYMAIQDDSAFDALDLSMRQKALKWARSHSGQNVYLNARAARGSSLAEVARARYTAIQDDSAFDTLDGSMRQAALKWARSHSGQNVYLDARAARGSVEAVRARYMAIQDDSAFEALDLSVRKAALQWARSHPGKNVYLDGRTLRGSNARVPLK
jgi:hypothetical protein